MKTAGIVVTAMLTSMATSVGVLYASHRFPHLLAGPAPEAPAVRPAVPELSGLSEADARTNLEAMGLKLVVAGRTVAAEASPGTVIAQEPAAGAKAGDDGVVRLTFALAPPEPPDVVGKPLAEAKAALEKAGFEVKVGEPESSATHAKDAVVAQEVTRAPSGDKKGEVTVRPSAGPADVEVPKLLGKNLTSAQEEAKKVGLEVVAQYISRGETPAYVVLSQKPGEGERVAPGTKVTVVINQ